MKYLSTRALFSFVLVIGLTLGCDYKGKQRMQSTSPTPVEISIHLRGELFQKRYPALVSVTRQPAGLSFYKANWKVQQKGAVKLVHGSHSLEIADVLNLVGTEDDEQKARGILKYSIVSGMSGPDGIDHTVARDYFFSVIDTFTRAGWRSTIPFAAPRLTGKDMMTYLLESGEYTTLRDNYRPTLDEWMKLEDLSEWQFYADGVFITLSFIRDQKRMDPRKPGSYIVNIEITSNIEHYKGFVDPSHREQWRELLPAAMKEDATRRQSAEEQLIKKGFPIDTEYRDPPVPYMP